MTRPRVGVPALLANLPSTSSTGRIWSAVIEHLRPRADIVLVPRPGKARRGLLRRGGPRVDVWLTDGHQGPLDVKEPVVYELHEATWTDPELRPLFEPAFLERYERPSAEAARRADALVTISETSKAQITEAYGVAPERIHVAHVGIDHQVYRPGRPGAGALLEAAGGDPGRPYVLCVSVVHPRKNLAALRDAIAGLARRGLPHTLVLVAGPAADRNDSQALLDAATAPIPGVAGPVVNLAGAGDDDVAALMCGASALCLPSLMEGFGMPVAEAMACGTPVVVSNRGALPEVVGDAGIVTEPDAPAVEVALHDVLTDDALARRLANAAHQRAQLWTWEAMAERWWQALLSVA